jgi:prepilin signal peptidase PulO-like enzyme (type II secretory pathway)
VNEEAVSAIPSLEERRSRSLAAVVVSGTAGFLSLLALIRYGISGDGLVAVFVIAVLVVLSGHDLKRRIIPNRIVLPAAAVVLVANVALHSDRWYEWLLASLGAGLFFLVFALARRGALGMGDVKLALFLGAALGEDVIVALIVGTLAAAALGIAILVREGSEGRKRAIPLGPFLAGGAIVVLLFL